MEPCRYCGAQGRSCLPGCLCWKCVDPVGFETWKREQWEEYDAWLAPKLDEDEWRRYNAKIFRFHEDEELDC